MSSETAQPRILALAGALRGGSLNRKLIALAVEQAQAAGADVTLIDLRDYSVPVYDGDCEAADGIPEGVARLAAEFAARDGFMLASPEYNFSVPGVVKNVVDWLSRVKPMPLKAKCAFLLSASPGLVGGNRGLWHLRVPLESLGVHVVPGMFSLASAGQAFDESGRLLDSSLSERLQNLTASFVRTVAALRA